MLTCLNSTTTNLVNMSKSLLPTSCNHLNSSLNIASHISALSKAAKTITKVVEELMTLPSASHINPVAPSSPMFLVPMAYANVTVLNPHPPTNKQSNNPETPIHIMHIVNKLQVQERQLYVTSDANAWDLPASRGGAIAYTLCGMLNEQMCSLDQEYNQVTNTSSHLIKSIQLTEHNTVLIQCNSSTTVLCLESYCSEKTILTHICSTAVLQPHTYCLVLKFIPFNGAFSPEDTETLCQWEVEHNLEEGSIVSATWIKKLGLHAQNQKTTNIKCIFPSPHTAN